MVVFVSFESSRVLYNLGTGTKLSSWLVGQLVGWGELMAVDKFKNIFLNERLSAAKASVPEEREREPQWSSLF